MRSRDNIYKQNNTNHKIYWSVSVVAVLIIFGLVFYRLKENVQENASESTRVFQHLEYEGVDTTVGPESIGVDGAIEPDSFATHLPLIVIDTGGEEIPDIYRHGEGDHLEDKYYVDPNITNPWIDMSMYIVDNEDHINKITDKPSFSNNGRIKLRGNSSREFAKKQYGIKLLDENGEELEYPLLGMEADEDWVICNSILDASYIRTYLAYGIGGMIDPMTPDVRFCELIERNGDEYEYKGLYLLTESIKKGKGRVDIIDYEGDTTNLSYLICRDRNDHTDVQLSTHASDTQLCYGWFSLIYPKNDLADPATIAAIGDEISEIEDVLYSDDPKVFLEYSKYIDVDSFVDYFVFNEFFMNYDSGIHSTFYYKDKAHKLTVGPFWDFDGDLDNYRFEGANTEWMVLPERPWFERLCRDPLFVRKVCARYHELRKTILSDEFIEDFVQGSVNMLGNAALRENSRWGPIYSEIYQLKSDKELEFVLDRTRETQEEEITRLTDVEKIHSAWLDENIESFLDEYYTDKSLEDSWSFVSILGTLMVVVFVVSVFLVSKLSKKEVT